MIEAGAGSVHGRVSRGHFHLAELEQNARRG